MPGKAPTAQDLIRDMGDGLVMRRATLSDRERVAEFNANTLLDLDDIPPLDRLYGFVYDLMSEDHPTSGPEDFLLVEETATGKVVSSICLMSQTWTYESIPFKFGQPDMVSTDPAYRRRGLVRAQMEEIHRWSAERGEMVQGITGIPWYYRQFGYEMALSLDASRVCFRQHIPKLKPGESEPFKLRPAAAEDVPFIMRMYKNTTSRSLMSSVRGEALWRYDIRGRHEKSGAQSTLSIIETPKGEPVGVLILPAKLWGTNMGARLFEVADGVPYLAVTPSAMRFMEAMGAEYAKGDNREFEGLLFELGETHPVYDTIAERLHTLHKPYAWYMRVPDVPAFVKHIVPALEKRLAASVQAGYTGQLRLSFYRSGVQLDFQAGQITVVAWKPERVESGEAAFPDLSFLPLLFGYRSLKEIEHAYPDCWTGTDDARALLPILFPKKDSEVWGGG